jgi:hypothetical protein
LKPSGLQPLVPTTLSVLNWDSGCYRRLLSFKVLAFDIK